MTVSRALNPKEPPAGVEAPVKGSAAPGPRPVGVGQPTLRIEGLTVGGTA